MITAYVNPTGAVQRPDDDDDELTKLYEMEDELETRIAQAERVGAADEADRLAERLESLRVQIIEVQQHESSAGK
jgi:hypothetical protein